ncbi:probable G-protein coupled receptor 141 [Sceloporus undulatus]|uniref:probable G-protein coupled receptor 141 n=1 Tax=Sceloporus undulatus TaxID=8520 RepID=UPI001C4AC8A0|nr:probable G-protein coupled receptor 141 [Sceloporus undulatus]XP_042332033.1 probable G-protein coupled receptor 141 [Sceloporus undulatus]XP_042332035.1 probable G-protein coupled receptor 141 [Sceloporus undulatus]
MTKGNSRIMAEENGTLYNINSSQAPELVSYHFIWNPVLITTYTVVFIGGMCGAIRMSFLLVTMNTLSVTTTAIINLVVIHSLFLVTVPFRLYYYITDDWIFEPFFCKVVSIMVHLHMYLTFLFYVIVLLIRGLIFFQWKDKVEFYRNLHAVAMSTAVWILAFATIVPVMSLWYGQMGDYDGNRCFTFHQEFKAEAVKVVNYTLIGIMVIITCALLGLQVFMLLKVVKKVSGSIWPHQEFRAQLKSSFFILVIIFCFLPHHFFRIYYIQHVNEKQYSHLALYNEVCLSITAISCLDLFSFVIGGRKILRQKIFALSCC